MRKMIKNWRRRRLRLFLLTKKNMDNFIKNTTIETKNVVMSLSFLVVCTEELPWYYDRMIQYTQNIKRVIIKKEKALELFNDVSQIITEYQFLFKDLCDELTHA